MNVDKELILKMYSTMLKIRIFEETVVDLYRRGLIPGLLHLYIGQEAVATGVCLALTKEDIITSTHRGHGHAIAKGVPLNKMMAELFGKVTGCCKGLSGSMQIIDPENGLYAASSIVGGGLPIAVGLALGIKLDKSDRVVATFFGDGAVNVGAFHESLNLAAIWKLPVIFVCENNQYAISVPVTKSTSVERISQRACAYNIKGITIDGMDVIEVYNAAREAVNRARRGDGPTLIECITYRYLGHHLGDVLQPYRTKDEIEEWKRKDPIERLKTKILSEGIANEAELNSIREEVQNEINNAVEYAKNSPYPDIDIVYKSVY